MRHLVKIIEGMHANDLKDLVLPLISVDEYVSKVSDEAIVLGFYVQDKDAANDLNRFIQKSAITLIDTDVSPAPDQHGYFLVFVEIMNNDRLGENLKNLLEEVSPLVDIDSWEMRIRGHDGLLLFSADALQDAVTTGEPTNESMLLKFLVPTDLHSARVIDPTHLQLETASGYSVYEIVGFGQSASLLNELNLQETAEVFSLREGIRTNRLQGTFGRGWKVTPLKGGYLVVEYKDSDNTLVLR